MAAIPTAPPAPEQDGRDRLAHRCRVRDAAGGLISADWCLDTFADVLTDLSDDLSPENMLRPELRLFADGTGLEVYYAPFELVNPHAKVVLVGITHGRQQMYLAIREVRAALRAGLTDREALERVGRAASFGGPMRANLIAMLDGIGLPAGLGVDTTAQLFGSHHHLVSTTSAISHPVFFRGENYAGRTPPIDQPAILRAFITQVLAGQLAASPDALVVPLGDAASTAVSMCATAGAVRREQCLLGFPHPSGGNGHRKRQYAERQEAMTDAVAAWFEAA